MAYNKEKYIADLKKQYGEFDDNFFIKENKKGEIITVVIKNKKVTDITNICECKTIQNLNLSQNNITSVVPLYGLSTIINLDVSQNQLKDLFGVASNVNIESLKASNNQIVDLSSMSVLPNEKQHLSKSESITLNGQEEIQKYIKAYSNENKRFN